MCVGTFSGVTSAGMVISSALGGTCQESVQKRETLQPVTLGVKIFVIV